MKRDYEISQPVEYIRLEDRLKIALKSSLATNGILLAFTSIIIFASIIRSEHCGFYGLESLEMAVIIFTPAIVLSAALGLIGGYHSREDGLVVTKKIGIFFSAVLGGFASFWLWFGHCGVT